MILIKHLSEIKKLEYVNRLGEEVLQKCYEHINPGVRTLELEEIAEKYCMDNGVRPSFKGYRKHK